MTKLPSTGVSKIAACTAAAMILFFLAMKLVGLVTIAELRFVNFILMFMGIRYALLQQKKSRGGKTEYLSGMFTGFMTAIFTSFFFAVFVAVYLFIDHGFLNYLRATQPFGSFLSPVSAALVMVIEGVAGGAIITFSMMHLFSLDDTSN
ncbi:MAG: hypothetical protein NT126_07265 [Bacteroidetes bacterium]|nr:hypothetical protein [Bacteroidota bacterium]